MVKFASADDALRAAIMRRFAEMDGSSPVRCRSCSDRKIVFPDRRSVEGAIAQFVALDGDLARYPYPCPGSTGWHYTKREQGGDGAADDEGTGLQLDHQ